MRVVCYTRFTSCLFGEENSPDIINQQNQRIKEFVKSKGYKLQTRYSDRKQDINADDAFTEMLNDGLARKYDLVIVDSLYRTGKNLWFAREMLLQTFYPAGIHFAVIEDNFCSISKTYDEVEAFFEEKVSQYHQETIRRRIIDRHKQGLLCWNDLKYGYQMTEDYQMLINPETAPVAEMDQAVCQTILSAREQALKIKAKLEEDGGKEMTSRLSVYEKEIRDLAYKLAELEKERLQIYINQDEDNSRQLELKAEVEAIEKIISSDREKMKTLRKAYSLENPRLKLYLEVDPLKLRLMERSTIRKYLGKVVMDVVTIKRVELLHSEWLLYFPKEWRETDGSKK
ncbi:hypothetical protein GKG47_15830 [Lactonifactor sp. BIOML-A3]|uniref:recombinase family protein n=1 Tax=unclassified Lactonifactor TaxID=2636670 RepID=UPI0012AF3BAE|nr:MULTISPECIES: recombinase family protein [unclassified Lactonifactor]MSA01707.1 hypothetical protein [Lactonifactor sp. BIOML-A5]MSA08705.1 hypothetical protein [Lactonifactor sp. BIOML-A4]MSA13899.1 hypothetical protein [Lactonifactor sp. BIOML-A3]MSA17140.1 hypothetical protein [Lactonifactor sp. BIOML-A2]MSA37819.1 hypothetical protein [Lactonifactor sp. BIOML-A1]